jgi:hypothetical protein
VIWKDDTSKVVAPVYVSYEPRGWYPRASIEHTDRMLIYGPSKCISLLWLSSLLLWL